ncbi:MAG TPA: THUMP domain-containing protein [Casimicrobiaceae bacterium]|jgi:putative N6-adenine-specific DNA methylase
MTERYFAPCPRGLEAALSDELTRIGASEIATTDGGVAFAGDLALAMHANLQSRLASRILWRVGGGPYRNEKDIYALVHAIDWHRLFKPERTLRVDVAATRSPLTSLEFVTLRTKDAVCDRFRTERGIRPSIDKRAPDVRIYVYLTDRDAIVYLDTSGEPLFKRGYRRDAEEAPLRENLAAGLLALARWKPAQTLLDPMCGSGTIVIEAAMIAAERAPGLKRSFGFQKLMWYDGPIWQRIKQSAHDRVCAPPTTTTLFGSDVEATVVAKATSNLKAAELEGFAAFERADALLRDAPAPSGILLTNAPYGVRLSDQQQLAAFYPRLGDALKRRFTGWTAYLFSGDMRLPKLLGLKVAKRTPLFNGALDCRLFEIPLVAGSMRDGPMLKSKTT